MAVTATQVLIVGAGPASQLLGLMLAKQDISVTIIEQSSKLDDNPRSTHYSPPAMKILNFAGVGEEVRAKGLAVDTVAWRRLDGTYIAGISHETQRDSTDRMIALPLGELAEILYEHAKSLPKIKYLFDRRVVSIGQDESEAWVEAIDHRAAFLFGDWKFPGKTWDEQIVATNVYYDFDKFGFCDSNFIIDPTHWYMAAKITKDGLWRVTYGEVPGLTPEELRKRQVEKFQTMLPGHPDPSMYKLANISPYKVHQRLAEKMRVGRFLLAADAAHLCNPFGGLGLTGGIVDVGGLYECLVGIYTGRADPSILDIYSDIRRKRYQEIVDPISSSNLRRMFTVHPDKVLESDEFLQMCKKAENDPSLAAQMLQHYSS
ncbi:FAD binding domain-containing [Fusarium albosuccineum]|uniref:FAD binding domain-containing n=1 Tax=Fusarium albosuccineum TaxID=1237068 RepID=A0A8H4PFF4_9HYPO|nr:FAD binding domain-containing [Fusarium albosuccineum]